MNSTWPSRPRGEDDRIGRRLRLDMVGRDGEPVRRPTTVEACSGRVGAGSRLRCDRREILTHASASAGRNRYRVDLLARRQEAPSAHHADHSSGWVEACA